MKIQKIQLKDYKRFHDLTIDLGDNPKRIVALVGPIQEENTEDTAYRNRDSEE